MADIRWLTEGMQVAEARFDPQLTLMDSAQVFHWKENTGVYSATIAGRRIQLHPCERGFILAGAKQEDEAFWKHYFDLERDYSRNRKLSVEDILKTLVLICLYIMLL